MSVSVQSNVRLQKAIAKNREKTPFPKKGKDKNYKPKTPINVSEGK
jgi:hypothetical protein